MVAWSSQKILGQTCATKKMTKTKTKVLNVTDFGLGTGHETLGIGSKSDKRMRNMHQKACPQYTRWAYNITCTFVFTNRIQLPQNNQPSASAAAAAEAAATAAAAGQEGQQGQVAEEGD